MKLKGSTYFLMGIMLLMLVIIFLSVRMEYMASKLLPLIFSSTVFVLGAIELVRELRPPKAAAKEKAKEAGGEEAKAGLRGYVVAGSWVVGFFLGIWIFGFMIAIAVFVLAYMKTHGTKWLTSIIFAVLTTAIIWAVFQRALGVELYPGLIPSLFE